MLLVFDFFRGYLRCIGNHASSFCLRSHRPGQEVHLLKSAPESAACWFHFSQLTISDYSSIQEKDKNNVVEFYENGSFVKLQGDLKVSIVLERISSRFQKNP